MLQIKNSELAVVLLDPVADRERQGSRYCWGGYIWQVNDHEGNPLFTGPEWPKPNPTAFNGQGLPESFRHRSRTGQPQTWKGNRGVALGIGELALDSKGEVEVTQPCNWTISNDGTNIVFLTEQIAGDYLYELQRTVSLDGRRLISSSRLKNLSSTPLSLEWFAHPFFALTDRLIEADVPAGTTLAENPGFLLQGNQLRSKRRFEHEKDGHMDFLHLPTDAVVDTTLTHPLLSSLTFSTDFAPSECVIWGKRHTEAIPEKLVSRMSDGKVRAVL